MIIGCSYFIQRFHWKWKPVDTRTITAVQCTLKFTWVRAMCTRLKQPLTNVAKLRIKHDIHKTHSGLSSTSSLFSPSGIPPPPAIFSACVNLFFKNKPLNKDISGSTGPIFTKKIFLHLCHILKFRTPQILLKKKNFLCINRNEALK